MGIVIDIIIILFILASAFFGYKKGLISLAINILAFIIAMVVTLLLYKPIGNIIINNTTVDEKLQQMIQTKIEEFMKNDDSKDSSSKLIESAKNGLLPDTTKSLSINCPFGRYAISSDIATYLHFKKHVIKIIKHLKYMHFIVL